MIKRLIWAIICVFYATKAMAVAHDFAPYFYVNMQEEIPNIEEYAKKLNKMHQRYNKGYVSRFAMGTMFKKEFSKIIKFYGLSEGRIKSNYEDELLEVLSWMPKESYQYIGPMLHEVPGMSEKILNLPGIKETKNQFPKDVAERFKAIENIEYLSPGLYFLLMPSLWDKQEPKDLDKPKPVQVKKPKIDVELPDFLKEKIGVPVKTASKLPASAFKKAIPAYKMNLRTINPTLKTLLTYKDVAAFVDTIDMILDWGTADDMENYSRLIKGEALLDMWEQEQGTALTQNDLKDVVNPCQRLVLKTRFSGLYDSFASVVAKKGFSPEEWAYTCDRTIKAFRVAESSLSMAYAVRYHRNGYYGQYIDKLPLKWQNEMYAVEEAIVLMYETTPEDINAVRPYQEQLGKKLLQNHQIMLTAPIIY